MRINDSGLTPLGCLLLEGHERVFKTIISMSQIELAKWCAEPILQFILTLPFPFPVVEKVCRVVQFLVKGDYCDISQCDSTGRTLLHTILKQLNSSWQREIGCSMGLTHLWDLLLSKPDIEVNKQDHLGNTPLHELCMLNSSIYLENKSTIDKLFVKLLSHKNIRNSLVCRNKKGKTPIQLLANQYSLTRLLIQYGANPNDVYDEFKPILDMYKSQHPLDPAVKILVLGNSTAGKTTFVKALHHLNKDILISVDHTPTAGIERTEHTSNDFGCVIFYDFAGQPEYESSNSAFLETCFQNYADSLSQAQYIFFL